MFSFGNLLFPLFLMITMGHMVAGKVATNDYDVVTMWTFGEAGIKVYSPDGSKVLKNIPADESCDQNSLGDNMNGCLFMDVRSDEEKYVWSTSPRGSRDLPDHVYVYSIDNMEKVKSIPTCSTPLTMHHDPLREEITVRCVGSPDYENDGQEIDIISTATLASKGRISLFPDHHQTRNYGRHVNDETLGNVGYATIYNQNKLFKYDLDAQNVTDEFELEKAFGAYEMSYSPTNHHLYIRSRVCCTCGEYPRTDAKDCGRGPVNPVKIQTGPSASEKEVDGTCGLPCMGTVADSIGIMEFDTVTDTMIATHTINDSFGTKPQVFSNGDYVVLFGGKNKIQVLKAGENGEPSTLVFEREVDLKLFVDHFSDRNVGFTVVEDDNRRILVLASSEEDHIILVDMKDHYDMLHMRKLNLTKKWEDSMTVPMHDPVVISAVRWAKGTNFVWVVVGSEAGVQYVVEFPSTDINDAFVARTIYDDETPKFLLPVAKGRGVQQQLQKQKQGEVYGYESVSSDDESEEITSDKDDAANELLSLDGESEEIINGEEVTTFDVM